MYLLVREMWFKIKQQYKYETSVIMRTIFIEHKSLLSPVSSPFCQVKQLHIFRNQILKSLQIEKQNKRNIEKQHTYYVNTMS